MRARRFAFLVSLCLAPACLAACGGGGGGGAASIMPPQAGPSGTSSASSAPVSVAISIAVPAASTSSTKRAVRYVSAGTKSATVTTGGNTQTTNCTSSCSLVVNVAPGSQTFAITLYDAANATGHVLSSGQTTATIVAGTNNAVSVTFDGVVASVAVALGASNVVAGTSATIPVTVTAKDAAGYTIVGGDPYASPIALSTDDSTGAFTLSASSVAAPGVPVNLAYNGHAGIAGVHVSAAIAGASIATTAATVIVQPAPTPTPVPSAAPAPTPVPSAPPAAPAPSGSVPSHVTTWYYYGLDDVNDAIPASYMAAHADYVEIDAANTVAQGQAFKSAGGKYVVSYGDPGFSTYCSAPFTAPAGGCRGPIGSLASSDESAWLHGADGARVHRFMSSQYQYQEAFNPASASARSAYATATASAVSAMPQLDYFFGDDSGGVFNGSDGTQLSGLLLNFNEPSVEIGSDAAFVAAEKGMLASAARPVFINGATPYTMQPSYNGAFLGAPNVAGQNFEGCYGDENGAVGDTPSSGPRWSNMSNALLAVYADGAPAICMNVASATPANRLYVLASWWMTYDPARSIIAPVTAASDGYAVFPEMDIVPRQPRATASGAISALKSGGAYIREFGACYQAGAAIGPCAAVVNPSGGTVNVPALAGHYSSALVLDPRSAYTGGTAAWSGAIPGQLASETAIIVR